MFIVLHATICFCMFLVGCPQTPEPVIPPGILAQIDLSCVDVPLNTNQSSNQSIKSRLNCKHLKHNVESLLWNVELNFQSLTETKLCSEECRL